MDATREKDGVTWRIGTAAEVAWIAGRTPPGLTITSAIPPVFERYATVVVPEEAEDIAAMVATDRALMSILRAHSPRTPWWLGYLDDNIFPDAPRITLYADWQYVLVEAGPDQALSWRPAAALLDRSLPDLIFPADRSWLTSRLYDDDWICVGGPAALVDALLRHPDLEARAVELGHDATPPGHVAY